MTEQGEIREDEEAREKHRSDWIKAEYEAMGWSVNTICQCWKDDICVKPLIEEKLRKELKDD